MSMRNRSSIQNLVLLFSLAALVACSQKSGSTAAANAVYRKALYAKVSTLDPSQLTDTASLAVANQIYDGLLEFDSHFQIKPALAESWTRSQDGLTMTFNLRKGLRFHDGSPVTSADCVASFERLLGPKSRVSNYYDLIEGAEEFRQGKTKLVRGLSAPNPQTFIIHLKSPFPPFSMVLAGATARILPKHLMDQPGFFSKPVGTGAFLLRSMNDSEIILERFGDYWREPAHLQSLRFQVLDEGKALELASKFEINDLVSYPLNGDEEVFTKGGQHLSMPAVATWLIGLNARSKPFNDVRVRRAFRNAVSAQDFTEHFYPGQTSAVGGYIPPGLPGHIQEASSPTDPVSKTRTLITLVIPKELTRSEAIAAYFQERLSKAGFNIKTEVIAWPEFMKRYNAKGMQAFLFSMNADYPDTEFLVRNFESGNADNFSGANSAKIDSLVRKARVTSSRVDRAVIYQTLARQLNEEAYTVNLMHYRAHLWFSNCIEGIELNSLGDVYIPYRTISMNAECIAKTQNKAAANEN
ncbi:MAG: ABC transporter substrate-binding protein [Bdellovibrionales bacterium]|nr:ABC transporter substrate-binding protein [Bdellovibrionales bacterium]